jgi:hypothetical protein
LLETRRSLRADDESIDGSPPVNLFPEKYIDANNGFSLIKKPGKVPVNSFDGKRREVNAVKSDN